jgi:hypothetical protein
MKGPRRSRTNEDPVGPTVLVSERLFGVRSWQLAVDDDGVFRLRGFYESARWKKDGKTTWARCRLDLQNDKHKAPDGRCSCGLYALHPWNADHCDYIHRPASSGALTVVGLVEAWGRVQLHPEGFRAQYARPREIALIGVDATSPYGRIVQEIASDHLAQLIVVANVAELKRVCLQRGLGLTRATVASLLKAEAA